MARQSMISILEEPALPLDDPSDQAAITAVAKKTKQKKTNKQTKKQ